MKLLLVAKDGWQILIVGYNKIYNISEVYWIHDQTDRHVVRATQSLNGDDV